MNQPCKRDKYGNSTDIWVTAPDTARGYCWTQHRTQNRTQCRDSTLIFGWYYPPPLVLRAYVAGLVKLMLVVYSQPSWSPPPPAFAWFSLHVWGFRRGLPSLWLI